MTKAELYQKACMLPLLPGVYIIRDKSDTIIFPFLTIILFCDILSANFHST